MAMKILDEIPQMTVRKAKIGKWDRLRGKGCFITHKIINQIKV